MTEDTRTMRDLANDAIRVQDACNLSGVVHGFSSAITRLRALMRELGRESTEEINTHPICVLWADKIADLTRAPIERGSAVRFSEAWQAIQDLAQ